MKHGDVFWYEFQSPDKRRPVVVLTRTSAIAYLTSITIAPIISTIRGIPTEVALSPGDGFANHCAINLDNIQTIPKKQLRTFHSHLKPEHIEAMHKAIQFALGIDV
jgi:mRNA interferase MazF